MTEPISTTVTPDESQKRIQSAIHAQIEAKVADAEARMLAGVADIVGKFELPQRPEFLTASGERIVKTSSPLLPLYRSMSEDERAIRNPDSDYYMAQFLRGVAQNQPAAVIEASGKLRAMFPEMYRADTLEGAAGASGAFGNGTGATTLERPLAALVAINRDRTAKAWRYVTRYEMSAQSMNVPTGGAMTAYMQDESTTPLTTGATFSQVQLVAYDAIAKAIVGNNMLADSATNLVSFFSQRGGAALGVLEDNEIFKEGTGSAPHITKLAGNAYTEGTTNALAYSDVLAMFHGVTQEYRANARWFGETSVLRALAGVKDTTGRPFYQALYDPPKVLQDTPTGAPDIGAQGTLLGRPVHDVPLTTGELWFGDPSAAYALGRREGITIEMSREALFETRRTVFLIRQRIAGNNLDTTNSTRHVAGITSATL